MPTLDRIGTRAALNHYREMPYHLLKCDCKLSLGDTGTLVVESDNLMALEAQHF